MKTIIAEDLTVEVAQVGRGRDLVMLHSLLTDHSAFDRVLPHLVESHRVTLLSLPGFGGSSPVASGIWNYAHWVAEALDAVQVDPESDMLGNGFGGSVAIAFAARYSRRPGRIILADAAATFPKEGRDTFRGMATLVARDGMGAILDVATRRLFPQEYIAANPGLADACRSILLRTDPMAFIAACETLAAMDLEAALPEIDNDILVIAGEHDAATPTPMCWDVASRLPNARYHEILDCGHAPQIQRPRAFLEIVQSFLDGTSTPA